MSVNALPKFNRGGLSGTTFGQRSSAKTTSGTSKQKAPNSISVSAKHYSLKNKKNSKYTAGTEISRGQTADYTALRRQNSTRGARFSSGVDSSFMTNAAIRMGMIQGAYGMQQGGMTTGMAILNGVGMVAQGLFGGVQQSRSVALDASMNSLGGGKLGIGDIVNNTELSSVANAMVQANDSTTLSSAIDKAQTALDKFSEGGPKLKSAAQDATRNLSSLEGGMKTASNAVDTAGKAVSDAKTGVTSAETSRTKAQSTLSNATSKYQGATKAYANAKASVATATSADNAAKANVNTAKATLNSTPKEITITNADGSTSTRPNPAYAQAEQALKQAEAQADKTAKALDKANKELAEAEKNVDAAEKAKVDADTDLKEAIEGCEKAEEGVAKAEQQVRDAEVKEAKVKDEFETAKQACEDAKKAISDYKDFEQNATALKNTISEQRDGLKKMLKAEKKQGSTPANNNKGTQGASDNGPVMTAEQFKNKLTTGDGTGITGFKDIGTAVCGQGPDGKMAYYMKGGSPLDQATFESMERIANQKGDATGVNTGHGQFGGRGADLVDA